MIEYIKNESMFYLIPATIAVSLVSLIGALLLFKKGQIHSTYGGVLVSAAAGVMLATAILDLLPEAVEGAEGHAVFWMVLAGIVFFFILERFLFWHHHSHEDGHDLRFEQNRVAHVKPTAYLILVGDSFHNFFDGIALATAFSVSIPLGMAMTLAVILHEIPQELADFAVLLHGGMNIKKALFYNFISGLTAVVGAILGWYVLQNFEGILPFLIAFNAGMFIYISCSDIIPALHEDFKVEKKWTQTITFISGIVLMGVLGFFLEV